ncbi:hypothetical protein CDL12_04369 [Handroanthus impetiginosus]|uniref:Homeobox-leucine zipper protein n=1 Tax=Handroanthus impetiginosus TaxID=429701 RepID=A0A2G9HZK1_9LAMI|nr:hypothetical protein CDL12_04369 [Handroanthus impetiginosus]
MESPTKQSPQKIDEKQSKNKAKNARRFSDEQIKSLESIFKVENKLEPRKKLQLARELGLQPRQVAIWFQNKRARWKSKQLEQEYRILRENYEDLYMKFDDLKRERQSLQMELQKLSDLEKNLHNANLIDQNSKFEEYPKISHEEMDHNYVIRAENEQKITNCFEKTQEQEVLSWGEQEGEISHLASPENWCNFPSGGLLSGSSSWWGVNE